MFVSRKQILCYSFSEIWGIYISNCLLNPELGIFPLITAFSAPSVELDPIRILSTSANINCNTKAITWCPSFVFRDVTSFKWSKVYCILSNILHHNWIYNYILCLIILTYWIFIISLNWLYYHVFRNNQRTPVIHEREKIHEVSPPIAQTLVWKHFPNHCTKTWKSGTAHSLSLEIDKTVCKIYMRLKRMQNS